MLFGRCIKLSVAFDMRLLYFILRDIQYQESKMKACNSFIIIAAVILSAFSPLSAQSPYTISWEKDGYIVGVGGAISVTGLLLYNSVSAPTPTEVNQLSRSSVNSFDRSAIDNFSTTADNISDVMYGAAAVVPFALFADKTMRDDWKTITLMYIETWSFIGGVSAASKGSIERYRPHVYNPNVPLGNKLTSDVRMSFFSNHTITAFASAVFLSTVYSDYYPNSQWKPYIWAGSLLAANTIGYLRYEAGMHFPTDILVGAIVGSAIGYTIPWLHRAGKEDISFIPCSPGANYGFSMKVRF
jgi:hypothetical protein